MYIQIYTHTCTFLIAYLFTSLNTYLSILRYSIGYTLLLSSPTPLKERICKPNAAQACESTPVAYKLKANRLGFALSSWRSTLRL